LPLATLGALAETRHQFRECLVLVERCDSLCHSRIRGGADCAPLVLADIFSGRCEDGGLTAAVCEAVASIGLDAGSFWLPNRLAVYSVGATVWPLR
jgi:hypothetical protein